MIGLNDYVLLKNYGDDVHYWMCDINDAWYIYISYA